MTAIIHSVQEWRQIRAQMLEEDSLGFVPTMGNLHAGHKSLLMRSTQENKNTVLSIFVNPTQFNNADDLKRYPRTLQLDLELAKSLGVNFVFIPEYDAMYVDDYRYKVIETQFSQEFCGKHRPGHFDGVLTVVLKLLNLIKPNKAYFGEKDFQQLQLVKAMVAAFFLDIEIVSCATVRDENGLAMSSRNLRLTQHQYQQALSFPRLLQANQSCIEIKNALLKQGFKVDYIEEQQGRRLGAVWVDDVRLIDNIVIKE